jgi:SAM-dependent methyltransferase
VSELSVIYPPTYYSYNYDEQVGPIAARGKELLDRLKFRAILKATTRPPRSFLDVGCGDGRYLKLMEKRGVPRSACYGVEIDDEVVEPLREAGYPVFHTRVEDCTEIPAGSIDLATIFNVIEHIEDPAAVARQVFGWLSPGGLFAVETPNFDTLEPRLFPNGKWGTFHIPRHWNLFTRETLGQLLSDNGFEVVGTQFQTAHAGWMFGMHHVLRYGRRPQPRLARLFDPFEGLLPFLMAFTALDKVRIAAGGRTGGMLMLARKPGPA